MDARGCEDAAIADSPEGTLNGSMRKLSGAMRVLKHSAADIVFADNGPDAGQRNVQAACFGKLRREEPKLHFAGAAWLGMKRNGKDGSRGGCACRSR